MEVLIASLWVAMCLYLLYETSVVYSYLSKFPFLNFMTHVKDYERERKDNWSLSYSLFMQLNHGGFMLDLLTCRYCLGAWLAIASTVSFGNWEWIPAVYFMSQLGYSGFKATDKALTRAGDDSNE